MESLPDTASAILAGNTTNLIIVAVLVSAAMAVAVFLLRAGLVQIGAGRVRVGLSEWNTRELLRRQVEYLENVTQEFVLMMERVEGFDEWRCRYAAEKVLDEMVKWCFINHISDDDYYVSRKQTIVWNVLLSVKDRPDYYRSDDFRKKVDDKVREIIRALVAEKKYFEEKYR
ncbi:hypothetical protein [Treponema saccharophilum]|uniref:hypothetical protein n=1 Tax=Treponema saccharophilum TaxID=165 RepID=UPI0038638C97